MIDRDLDVDDISFPLSTKTFQIEKVYLLKSENYQARIEKRGNKANSIFRFSERVITGNESVLKQRRIRAREYEALSKHQSLYIFYIHVLQHLASAAEGP